MRLVLILYKKKQELAGDPLDLFVPVQQSKDSEPNSLELELMQKISTTVQQQQNDVEEEEEDETTIPPPPPPLPRSTSTEHSLNFLRLNSAEPTNEGRSWLRHLRMPPALKELGGSFQPNKTKFENL